MLTIAQLRTLTTQSEALQYAVDTLADVGLNAKSWQSGSWQLTLVRLFTDTYASLTGNVKALAEMLFLELSTGDALKELAKSHYDVEAAEATRARHTLRLTAPAGVGPYTVTLDTYTVQETVSGKGYYFTAVALPNGATLNPASTLDIEIEAQVAGSGPNVAVGAISKQITPLAGVTISNIDVGDGTSLVTAGTDAQSDESIRTSCRTKWGSLTWATPADGYIFYAKQGTANAARVKVDDGNPRGPGTIDIYIAGATGVAAAQDVIDAQARIAKKHAGTPDPLTIASAAVAQNFSGNLYVKSAHFSGGVITAAKQAEIEDAIRAYVNTLPIGGKILPPPDGNGVTGYMLASEWQGAATAIDGVEAIKSPSPSADVTVAAFGILTVGVFSFTYVAI